MDQDERLDKKLIEAGQDCSFDVNKRHGTTVRDIVRGVKNDMHQI